MVTAKQLLQKIDEFYAMVNEYAHQSSRTEELEDLRTLHKLLGSVTAHVDTAAYNASVLRGVALRMQKILIVCSGELSGPVNGWFSGIDYTWKARSEVGQKCIRKSVKNHKTNVHLYDPETDTSEDVTERFKETEEFIDFS